MENPPVSGSALKVQEYVNRIEGGESKESIMDSLPPSFITGIEAELKERQKKAKLAEVKKELGMETDEQSELENLVTKITADRKQVVVDLYTSLVNDIDNPESRRKLISALFGDVYNTYRISDYPVDPEEEKVWGEYLHKNTVEINNKKPEWMYRGNFPKHGEGTLTRASFNVHVTPELIDSLDNMISTGKIKANYKFGQPDTSASPTARHDSISMYFLEEPTDEALKELSAIVKPFARGDNLLGNKISEGFFMSEIGSVETKHIEDFVTELETKDPSFAEAIRQYTTPRPDQGKNLKMSEAQFYAIKDVANVFGYEISYDKEKGFELK